jgi:predicted MFS family arabinose efflux permease
MSLRPLRLPAFRRLLVAYSVNQLGDWAAEISLAVIVFAATHSPAAVAATWVVHRCALALLAPLLVARLEGYRADRLLPAIYVIEAALFVGVAFAAPVAGLPVVLALVAVDGLLATTARALARSTLVSVTRPAGMHCEGNALINVVFTVNGMIAPVLGGVLVAAMGAPAALTVNAASLLIAAGALAGCPPMQSPAAGPAAGGAVARLRDALDYVSRRSLLRGLLRGDAALAVFVAMITPVEIAFVTDTLHGGTTALGAVLTAWGVGMVAGGALAGRLRTAPLPALLLSAGAAEGAACLGMGFSWTLVPVLAFSALGGVGNGIYGMAIVTAIQERTSDVYQARINGLYDTLMTIAPGLGFAVGGVLATLSGPRTAYLVAGAGAFAVLAWSVATLRLADWSVCSEDALTCSADGEPRTVVSVAA